MALLASAGDLSGAESPVASVDGGASWPPRGSSFGAGGGGGNGGGGADAFSQAPALMMPPVSLPPLLAAHPLEETTATDLDADDSDSDDSDDGSGASSASSVFTLCNSAIGAGVLSLPFAFRRSGLGGGLALCCAVGGIEAFTL